MTLELWLLKFQKVKQSEEIYGVKDSPLAGSHFNKVYVTLGNFSGNLSRNKIARHLQEKIAECNRGFNVQYTCIMKFMALSPHITKCHKESFY